MGKNEIANLRKEVNELARRQDASRIDLNGKLSGIYTDIDTLQKRIAEIYNMTMDKKMNRDLACL